MTKTDPTQPIRNVDDLIASLDAAVAASDDSARCKQVMETLIHAFSEENDILSEAMCATSEEGYARRLLYRHPHGAYSVVVMVWGAGQGTPLHDHAGTWCVECVCQGSIKVTNFRRDANRDSEAGILDFSEQQSQMAGVGEAGKLIPPFEYHILENPGTETAVTLHVYGGEILRCNTFEEAEGGGYKLHKRELAYTP
ncbi:MAG: cysteine dioxygenase family protein [Planctomycetota bacterium]|nr:cysteine dioxygenase family protein [Planctomycetota bacterium]MDA1114232.1 cysteine dioxygenase family protein [Planctomycetota bacterium]